MKGDGYIMCQATTIAKWFIKSKPYNFQDTFDSNMKLNKLLYFCQLLNLIKYNKPIFTDELFAFKNGVVIENVRKEYKDNYHSFITNIPSFNFTSKEQEILTLTENIFGDVSPSELSKLSHEHRCWKDYYEKSKCSCGYNKEKSIIPINDILERYQSDLDLIRKILNAYEKSNEIEENELCITVNNINFFYNPKEININDEIMNVLENFPASENNYSLYQDEVQGLIIF